MSKEKISSDFSLAAGQKNPNCHFPKNHTSPEKRLKHMVQLQIYILISIMHGLVLLLIFLHTMGIKRTKKEEKELYKNHSTRKECLISTSFSPELGAGLPSSPGLTVLLPNGIPLTVSFIMVL